MSILGDPETIKSLIKDAYSYIGIELVEVDWNNFFSGRWYEVARTNNGFQHKCGGSILEFTKRNCCSSENNYRRIYFTNGYVTKEFEGLAYTFEGIPNSLSLCKNYERMSFHNFTILAHSENMFIMASITGNLWVYSRCPVINECDLRHVIEESGLPKGLFRRLCMTRAKIPPPCCS